MIIAIIFWLVLDVLVGVYASKKGRSGIGFFFISLFLSPLIGFIIVLVVEPIHSNIEAKHIESGELRKCPYCAELVKFEAIVCKHCGRDLPRPEPTPAQKAMGTRRQRKICWNCRHYTTRGIDESAGRCTLHGRKTRAPDTCDDFINKFTAPEPESVV